MKTKIKTKTPIPKTSTIQLITTLIMIRGRMKGICKMMDKIPKTINESLTRNEYENLHGKSSIIEY